MESVVGWLRAERAEEVRAISVRGLLGGAVGDCLVFASGRSPAHMTRIARAIQHEFKAAGVLRYGQAPAIEGRQSDDWLLVDGGDVVVSVMTPESRATLQLEEHWQAQGATELELPADELAAPHAATPAAAAAAGTAVGGEAASSVREHWGLEGTSLAGDAIDDVYREDGDVILDAREEAALEAAAAGLGATRASGEGKGGGEGGGEGGGGGGSGGGGGGGGKEDAEGEVDLESYDEYLDDEYIEYAEDYVEAVRLLIAADCC